MKLFVFLLSAIMAIDPMMLMMMMNSNPNQDQAGQMNMMLPLLLAGDDSKVIFTTFNQGSAYGWFFLGFSTRTLNPEFGAGFWVGDFRLWVLGWVLWVRSQVL